MKKFWSTIVLIFIVCTAFFLRVNKIASIPPGLSWDEVSIGYNAFSILKTGKDEHGRFLPLDTFVAYGDYKPPLAIYLTVPFVAVFGLNELAVRLPSAIFGTLTVFLTYVLVSEVFRKKLQKRIVDIIALLSSFLLAVSPWHINISRAGFEANIALFFIVLGVYLILIACRKPKLWSIAWLPFVLSVYTFNSARYFAPLFGLFLFLLFYKTIREHWKQFLLGACIALLALVPILSHLVSKEARLRFAEVNIFTDSSVVLTANERMAYDKSSILGKLLHNRRVGYSLSYLRHFTDNLQPSFLFIKGDGNPKFSTQVVGQMYMVEAPFLAIGIIAMFVTFPQIAWMLLLWIVLAIIPAATARETPHALRILNSLPMWQVFVAYGIIVVFGGIAKINWKRKQILTWISGIVLAVLYIFSIGYYLHNYYAHYAKSYSGEWQYGYREALASIKPIADTYEKIYISSEIGRPYMYALFYTKYDPDVYRQQKDASFDEAGFYHVYGFGKYRFIDTLPTGGLEKSALYITGSPVPSNARIINRIPLVDGSERLVVFDKQ